LKKWAPLDVWKESVKTVYQ